jgi:FkbM family methyltransferase
VRRWQVDRSVRAYLPIGIQPIIVLGALGAPRNEDACSSVPARIVKDAVRRLLPRRPRPHRILSGPLRGRRIVTSWHDYPGAILGTTELALVTWLKSNVRPGETWLDIGAHYGYTAIALCDLVGPNGRVFAFEPVLSTAGNLSLTRGLNRLNQLTVVPMGLDDSTTIRPLSVPTTRGMANHLNGATRDHDTIYLAGFEAVWDALAAGRPEFHGVKVDVQGMELAVLRGMARYLKLCRPKVVVEFHSGVDREALLSTLFDLGYASTGTAVDPLPGEQSPGYHDDRSYFFGVV